MVFEEIFLYSEFIYEFCVKWEVIVNIVDGYNIWVCMLRMGVVFVKNGGVLVKMVLLFKLGVGGKLGYGK